MHGQDQLLGFEYLDLKIRPIRKYSNSLIKGVCMERDLLLSLKAQSVKEILWQLVQSWRADSNTDTWPTAVRLTSGFQNYSGYPLQIEDKHQQLWLALYQPRNSGSSSASVRYIALDTISSIEIDVSAQVPSLFNAGQSLPSEEQIPSKLNVDRTIASSQSALQQVGWEQVQLKIDWTAVEASPALRYRVTLVLRSLPRIAQGICKDALGKESLNQIKTLTLKTENSMALTVTIAANEMQILIGAESHFLNIEKQLQQQMEKAL
jgi:hypothetical protein